MHIRKENLAMALYMAIQQRAKTEKEQGYPVDSSLLSGWREALKHLSEGGNITITN